MATVLLHDGTERKDTGSLLPYLRCSLALGCLMLPDYMRPNERTACRWVGFGIGKGVTHPEKNLSILALSRQIHTGLHGELVKGLPGVDLPPRCYDDDHQLGFGGFFRWSYFADPSGTHDVFGLDWSLVYRLSAGVANSMLCVETVARAVIAHGIPATTELVLLNCRMCEDRPIQALRERLGLITVGDWGEHGDRCFGPDSGRCPRCGLDTMKGKTMFCYRCGCKPELFWQEKGESRL